ncbi:MAG: class I SAM-dependent methyltransferase [Clostridia bacterium]|nr:class I SAM-dependent methyltransferase [Clostridia bacterium]
MNEYRALAEYYDRLMGIDYEALADNIVYFFEQYRCEPRTVLDLGCGSGSLMAALSERGYDMIGVDSSEDMLAIAAEKCPDSMLLCQDIRELDLYDVVDATVCTLDTLNHLLKTSDLASVFDRLRLFIAPDGLLIFDFNTQAKHRQTLGNNTLALEDDGLMCVWQNSLNDKTCTVTMQLDFFEEDEDGRYVRTTDVVRERAYSYKTWETLLADAGFEILSQTAYQQTVSDFESSAQENGDLLQRGVIVARNTRPAEEFSV